MPLTNRDWRRPIFHLLLPALLTGLIIGLIGPFGTYTRLALADRLLYWISIIGINWFLCSLALRQIDRHFPGDQPRRLVSIPTLASLLISIPATAVVDVSGRLVTPPIVLALPSLYWKVLVLCLVITVPAFAIRKLLASKSGHSAAETLPAQQDDPREDRRQIFLSRFDEELPGKLLALESQDHYLAVHTTETRKLLLYRLQDAEKELEGVGLRVHRSWWVASDAIKSSQWENGRVWLVLVNGERVPVSRRRLPQLRARDWIR